MLWYRKMRFRPTMTELSLEYASSKFPSLTPDGLKYAFHYGVAGAEDPIIRFDNHHAPHELHLAGQVFELDFDGLQPLYQAWRAALPPEKRTEW
jgi:hypothetical protein